MCKGADDLNDHDVATKTPARTTQDSLEQTSNASKGERRFVALIIDSWHMFYRRHDNRNRTIQSSASVNMTPFDEINRVHQPCTDGDFVSEADKGQSRSKSAGKRRIGLERSNFILSLNKDAYVATYDFTSSLSTHSRMPANVLVLAVAVASCATRALCSRHHSELTLEGPNVSDLEKTIL